MKPTGRRAWRKRWESVRKELGIKEEQRTVYAVGRRAWMTKDAAIRAGLKALAARLDFECECSKGDSVTPDYYCGCHERREQMISRMTPIVKAMPASKAKWDRMILMYEEAGFLDDDKMAALLTEYQNASEVKP